MGHLSHPDLCTKLTVQAILGTSRQAEPLLLDTAPHKVRRPLALVRAAPATVHAGIWVVTD